MNYTKAFDCVDHTKRKILKEMEISNNFTCLLRNLVFGSKSKLEPYMEQRTGSKLGKEYIKAVYYHPPYFIDM